jgi:hypothetical protein
LGWGLGLGGVGAGGGGGDNGGGGDRDGQTLYLRKRRGIKWGVVNHLQRV